MRSITEILKDVDKATSTGRICELYDEIENNKYKYPLIQKRFAKEHIDNAISSLLKKESKQWEEFIKSRNETKRH